MHPLVPRMITSARASGGGGWMRANCLACPERAGKNDTKQSFAVNSKSGYYRCLRCGLKGFVDGAERRFSEKALDDSARKAEQGDEECRKLPTRCCLSLGLVLRRDGSECFRRCVWQLIGGCAMDLREFRVVVRIVDRVAKRALFAEEQMVALEGQCAEWKRIADELKAERNAAKQEAVSARQDAVTRAEADRKRIDGLMIQAQDMRAEIERLKKPRQHPVKVGESVRRVDK